MNTFIVIFVIALVLLGLVAFYYKSLVAKIKAEEARVQAALAADAAAQKAKLEGAIKADLATVQVQIGGAVATVVEAAK